MDYKALEKLAKACRKAGIKHYKDANLEFTLADETPAVKPRGKNAVKAEANAPVNKQFESDSISEDELLMWSAGEIPEVSHESN